MKGRLVIQGGKPLIGDIEISGAKNSALKILAGCLLATKPVEIKNVPHLYDVTVMLQLLAELGVKITVCDSGAIRLDASEVDNLTVPYPLVKVMRASIVVLGPLLARFRDARVSLPGGCAIGPRPIDLHLDGFRAMGADIQLEEGFVHAKSRGPLKGCKISMKIVSVTATENLMMAACLADGVVTIKNAAKEPEVIDLANFLNKLGAKVTGAGTSKITVEGVKKLGGCEYSVMPDRIEAGTYLVAAAMTKGRIKLHSINSEVMKSTLTKLRKAGAKITSDENTIELDMSSSDLKPVDIDTAPYPGLATDMQAQFIAMNVVSKGVAKVTENIFENRFMHVPELLRLGANIKIKGHTATCRGVQKLSGAPVTASDLRASACLVLAGLVAEGKTVMDGVHHIDRGYEYLEEKLKRLGADITRLVEE